MIMTTICKAAGSAFRGLIVVLRNAHAITTAPLSHGGGAVSGPRQARSVVQWFRF